MGELAKRVLVVDDEEQVRELLCDVLGEEYEVSLEASAARALRRLDELRPDLILLDVDMPDMDGIEALREIKARDASVIVVMVTGTIDRAVMDQAMSLGAHAFVPKPFRIASVIEAVRAALATRPAC